MTSPDRPRIHITALASSATQEIARLTTEGVEGMMRLAQAGAGDRYRVTASPKMLLAREIDPKGGRFDDAERAREVERLLADDRVAALVTIRGGAWFTRVLERINFDVLRRRKTPLHLFGFSEMTTLIAIAGQYPTAVALYDLGPGFLYGGPKWYARRNAAALARELKLPEDQHEGFAAGWAWARFPQLFTDFFRDVGDILDGRGSSRVSTGCLLAGKLPRTKRITITGGNLSVVLPLVGSRYASAIDTRGKWLALEDVNEAADPMDRMMAGLKLAGLFERAEGVILGDFHDKDTDLRDASFEILRHHLPPGRNLPVVRLDTLGHIWPIAPLPIGREVTLCCEPSRKGPSNVRIEVPWQDWAWAARPASRRR